MRKARQPKPIEGNYRNWSSLAAYREDSRQARQLLRLVRNPGRPAAGVRLYSAMRNEHDILPLFLDHYRTLGATRFVIVDNDSSDGSRELLLDQPDVELYHTAASYADANAGSLWIDALLEEQAEGAWVVYADADELLVYDGCDRHPLPALAGRLEALGETRLLAPLLDVYSRPATPQDLLFDALPEQWHNSGRSPHITGGPRCRMAAAIIGAQPPALTKYPLVRYGPRVSFVNVHFPEPRHENSNRIRGRLLHLKLTPRFRGKVAEALREGQHWNEGSEYRGYAKWLDSRDIGDLVIADSRRYLGPSDLIAAGLLEPLDWQRSNTSLRIKRALRRVWRSRR
jgi:glycosyl transferase family 2